MSKPIGSYNYQPVSADQMQMTITNQPGHVVGVPSGLEALAHLDQIIIKQKIEKLEAILGYETKNKYSLRNTSNYELFYAAEESDCCSRNFLGKYRTFIMHIRDNLNKEVITVYRPCKCCSGNEMCACCGDSCRDECTISTQQGVVAKIWKQCGCAYPHYTLELTGGRIFRIDGPCGCKFLTCADKKFAIHDESGNEIGEITKTWKGCCKETFTDADNFRVAFPVGMDINSKAAIIGAMFLIDFNYFEHNE
ncbi:hypothetical protein WR25_05226 [Diploscapter pachys]|uniref:Phospholipid scramblase n=1 Tax=Diploscapter pachys TaxID=2018661 RepID=A0A2A2LPP1_9BILA|nr:hypothetical protein WR25_05226 [Diploscapter pachys]